VQALTELLKARGNPMQEAGASIDAGLLQKWDQEWEGKLKAHVERFAEEITRM